MSTLVISSKEEVFQQLLATGGEVYVNLVPLHAQVPPVYKPQTKLVLLFGLNLPRPTSDVVTDHFGITATLSFDQEPFYVVIPWDTVYAIVDEHGDGVMWAETAPLDVVDRAKDAQAPRTKLSVMDGGLTSSSTRRKE